MSPVSPEDVSFLRAFNRFYTGLIGVLGGGLLDTPYSLTEARILFELGQRGGIDASEIARALSLDAGYLSRLLTRFEHDGLITRERSASDARRRTLSLTQHGRDTFDLLDSRSAAENAALLERLPPGSRRTLLRSMAAIREVLEGTPRPRSFLIRAPRPGDYGWVIARHGAIYAEEYRWDESFETLVARIVADFLEQHNPRYESAWIAEVNGDPAGCIFCVQRDETTAQLRLLLVEPSARGLGIGSRLVEECLRFARQAGYSGIGLWTNDVLVEARRIYERAGFRLVEEDRHHSFGRDLVGQNWFLDLGDTKENAGASSGTIS